MPENINELAFRIIANADNLVAGTRLAQQKLEQTGVSATEAGQAIDRAFVKMGVSAEEAATHISQAYGRTVKSAEEAATAITQASERGAAAQLGLAERVEKARIAAADRAAVAEVLAQDRVTAATERSAGVRLSVIQAAIAKEKALFEEKSALQSALAGRGTTLNPNQKLAFAEQMAAVKAAAAEEEAFVKSRIPAMREARAAINADMKAAIPGFLVPNLNLGSLKEEEERAKAHVQRINSIKNVAKGAFSGLETASLGITAIGAASIKMASDYEKSMTLVANNSGMVRGELEAMKKVTRELSDATGESQERIAKAYARPFNQGFRGPALRQITEEGTKLAVATGDTPDVSTNIISRFLSAYKMGPEQAHGIGNALLLSAQRANLQLPQMTAHMEKSLGTAAGYGMDPASYLSTYSTVAQRLGPAMTDTQITGLINNIVRPTEQVKKAIAALKSYSGIDVSGDFNVQALQQKGIPGILDDINRAAKGHFEQAAAPIIPNQRGRLAFLDVLRYRGRERETENLNRAAIAGSGTDVSGQALARIMATPSQQMAQMKAQVTNQMIDIGKDLLPMAVKLLPAFKAVADSVLAVMRAFTQMPAGIQEAVFALSAFKILSLGTGLNVLPGLGAGVKGLAKTFKDLAPEGVTGASAVLQGFGAFITGPLGIALVAGTALVAGLALAWKNDWGHIREVTASAIGFLTPAVTGAWNEIKAGTLAVWNPIKEFLTSNWTSIKTIGLFIWGELKGGLQILLGTFASMFRGTWENISGIVRGAWDVIAGVIKVGWSVVAGVVTVGLKLLSLDWRGAWDSLKKYTSLGWDGIKQAVSGGVNAIRNAIVAFGKEMFNLGSALWAGLIAGIKGGGKEGMINAFGEQMKKGLTPEAAAPALMSSHGRSPLPPLSTQAAHGRDNEPWKHDAKALAYEMGLRPISEFRPGARTRGTGRTSLHALNEAIDFSGTPAQMDAFFNAIKSKFGGRIRELLYSPDGQVTGNRFEPTIHNAKTRADHYNHVHVALANYAGEPNPLRGSRLPASDVPSYDPRLAAALGAASGGGSKLTEAQREQKAYTKEMAGLQTALGSKTKELAGLHLSLADAVKSLNAVQKQSIVDSVAQKYTNLSSAQRQHAVLLKEEVLGQRVALQQYVNGEKEKQKAIAQSGETEARIDAAIRKANKIVADDLEAQRKAQLAARMDAMRSMVDISTSPQQKESALQAIKYYEMSQMKGLTDIRERGRLLIDIAGIENQIKEIREKAEAPTPEQKRKTDLLASFNLEMSDKKEAAQLSLLGDDPGARWQKYLAGHKDLQGLGATDPTLLPSLKKQFLNTDATEQQAKEQLASIAVTDRLKEALADSQVKTDKARGSTDFYAAALARLNLVTKQLTPDQQALVSQIAGVDKQAAQIAAHTRLMQNASRTIEGIFANSFDAMFKKGGNFFKSLGDGFKNLAQKIVVDWAASKVTGFLTPLLDKGLGLLGIGGKQKGITGNTAAPIQQASLQAGGAITSGGAVLQRALLGVAAGIGGPRLALAGAGATLPGVGLNLGMGGGGGLFPGLTLPSLGGGGFTPGFNPSLPNPIDQAGKTTAQSIQKTGNAVSDSLLGLVGIFQQHGSHLSQVLSALAMVFSSMKGGGMGGLGSIFGGLSGLFSKGKGGGGFLGKLFSGASFVQGISSLFAPKKKKKHGLFGGILGGIGSIFGKLGGGLLGKLFTGIGGGFPGMLLRLLGGGEDGPLGDFLPMFGDGGFPSVGMPSIVGERGPELFIPQNRGRIISNSDLNLALQRGGNTSHSTLNAPITVTVHNTVHGGLHTQMDTKAMSDNLSEQILREVRSGLRKPQRF